jgi:hypothetical protein
MVVVQWCTAASMSGPVLRRRAGFMLLSMMERKEFQSVSLEQSFGGGSFRSGQALMDMEIAVWSEVRSKMLSV